MIQDRVLKIYQRLNTFSSDDLISMTDIEETEVEKVLHRIY